MSRNVFAKYLLSLALLSGLNACIEKEFESYSLHVKVRGLSDTETIIVSNGSNLEIRGTADLSWTELQTFKQKYREDSTNFSVRIARQPTSSNKVCRVLNPNGQASTSVSIVRIECGYPVVIADAVSYASYLSIAPQPASMTTDNGLIVSNYLEEVALNSTRTLTMSLNNEDYQDPGSLDPNDRVLRVSPNSIPGAISFQKLYNENETVTLSFTSVNQGCEITGANDNSGLVFTYPSSGTFMDTVQTIARDQDWILDGTDFSNGRSCSNFTRLEYFLAYDELENTGSDPDYLAECYPTAPVEMTCGFALKVKVRGLDTNTGEFIRLTGTRMPSATSHTIDLTDNFSSSRPNRGIKTFNLAFVDSESYTIVIDGGSNLGGKTCVFSSTGGDSVGGSYPVGNINNSNKTETITCNQ